MGVEFNRFAPKLLLLFVYLIASSLYSILVGVLRN